MVEIKHSALDLLNEAPAQDDEIIVRDISDIDGGSRPNGKTKRISVKDLVSVPTVPDVTGATTLAVGSIHNISGSNYAITLPDADGTVNKIGDKIFINTGNIGQTITVALTGSNKISGYSEFDNLCSNESFVAEVVAVGVWRITKKVQRDSLFSRYAGHLINHPYLSSLKRTSKTKCISGINLARATGKPEADLDGNPANPYPIRRPIGNGYEFAVNDEYLMYAARGLGLIRMGFLWERVQDELYGELDEKHVSAIHQQIQLAQDNNQEIILNVHSYARYQDKITLAENYIGSTEVPYEAFFDLWEKLGKEFGNIKGVHFGIMNEPEFASGNADLSFQSEQNNVNIAEWVENMQKMCILLRDQGIGSHLQFSTNVNSSASSLLTSDRYKAWEGFYDPADNWTLGLHQYLDDDLNGAGNVYINTGLSRAKDLLLETTQWARSQGIKLHLGEFGVPFKNSYLSTTTYGRDNLSDLSLLSINELLEFLEENPDVWVSFTAWDGNKGWPLNYPQAFYPKESQNLTYDPDFENDVTNRAYDADNLQLLTNFSNINDLPDYYDKHVDFINDRTKGFLDVTDLVTFSRPYKAMTLNKNGGYDFFVDNQMRITDLGYSGSPQRMVMNKVGYDDLQYSANSPLKGVERTDNVLAPDGSLNAFQLKETLTNAQHFAEYAMQKTSLVQNDPYAFSVHVQRIDLRYAYLNFNGVADATILDFQNAPMTTGATDWVRIEGGGINTGAPLASNPYHEILMGFQETDQIFSAQEPQSYLGVGRTANFWHPQIEHSPESLSGGEYEGTPFATAPIYGVGGEVTRAADSFVLNENFWSSFNGDFTFFIEYHRMPIAACKMPIFKLNGVNLLQRSAGSRIQSPFCDNLQTDVKIEGNKHHYAGNRVGISVNRATGDVILYSRGAMPVELNMASIPTVSGATLANFEGFTKSFGISEKAMTKEELYKAVNKLDFLPFYEDAVNDPYVTNLDRNV